jgi:hypothetical protein
MAYEIYFDSQGKLRQNFKTHKYKDVLQELLSTDFTECRNFIADRLKDYSQKVVYIPGEESIELVINLDVYREEYVDHDLYCPSKIYLESINIMYNSEGVELSKDRCWYGNIGGNLDLLIEYLREKTVATQRGLSITYVADKYFDEKISEITIPHNFQLLRYSN